MAQHQVLLTACLFLYLLVPSLALDFSDIDTKYFIIGGVAAGAVLLVIVIGCCCCCCCKKKKQAYQEQQRQSTPIRRQEVRPSAPEQSEFRRNESPRSSAPPRTQAPPLVRTESEIIRDARAEHRRRLDAILTTQVSSATHRNYTGDSSSYDRNSHHSQLTGQGQHLPAEFHLSRQQYQGDTRPCGFQTDMHDRATILSSSHQDKSTHKDEDHDNIMASFERIQPHPAPQGQRTRKERELALKSAPPIEDQPEFMGIKLKPIVLNKTGGTYIPPEDF